MNNEPTRNIDDNLRHWAQSAYGVGAEVSNISRMPGHSGITYGFRIDHEGRAEDLVMRVPPIGVRQKNNLDVVRFAPVLDLAHHSGVPVPAVRWWSPDERWFGTPYLMVSRVEGEPLPDVFESGQSYPDRPAVDSIFRQAMQVLAGIHSIDATGLLETRWAEPATREQDLAQWLPLLQKSQSVGEIERTEELGRKLLAAAPPEVSPRVVHGDYYSNNWMVNSGSLSAVLDWENTTLNDPGWDLGWVATIYDRRCWGPSRFPGMDWHPQPGDLYELYESASGQSVRHSNWYQALMCYRLVCITPAKVRLHRTGRRIDPVWETFAEAVPYMLDTAFELLKEDP